MTSLARSRRLASAGGMLVLLVVALALPSFTSQYVVGVASLAGVYVILALSWNLIGGFAGLFSMGQAGFFGCGAYITAICLEHQSAPWWVALVAAAGGTALLAVALIPCFRTSGAYFAILTLALAETLRQIGNRALPHGGDGISITPVFDPFGSTTYLVVVLVAMLAVLTSLAIRRSRFGLALAALRSDEQAAQASGIDTARVKALVMLASAAMAGVAGGLYTMTQAFVTPDVAFSLDFSVLPLLMTILGGLGTVLGPVLGAIGWSAIDEILRNSGLDGAYNVLVYGAVLALLATVLPRGLAGIAQAVWPTRTRRGGTAAPDDASMPVIDPALDESRPAERASR